MMNDIINDKNEIENPDVILGRYEKQIRDRWQEKDIVGLSKYVFSIVEGWGRLVLGQSKFDNPYDHLEHAVDMPKSTARVYYYIGKAINKDHEFISRIGMDRIRSPYMLLSLDKAFNHYSLQDVESALTKMSYREFTTYANPKPVNKDSKENAKQDSSLSNRFSHARVRWEEIVLQLRSWYDDGLEVYVVGVRNDEQWQRIQDRLSQIALEPNNTVDTYSIEYEGNEARLAA